MDGTEKLKIGELAEKANVTKRTIDHYTNIGLLKAERSPSNYRYYDSSAIERLQYIERYKKDGMALDEIKRKLIKKETEEIDIRELKMKMMSLEKDVSKVLSNFNKNDGRSFAYLKENISHESLSLIQTLLILFN